MAIATVLAPARDVEGTTQADRGASVSARNQYRPQQAGMGLAVPAPGVEAGRVEPGRPTRRRATTKRASTPRPRLGPIECRRVAPAVATAVAPVRLTRRGVVASWVVGVLALGVIAFGLVQGASPVEPARAGTTVVTVMPGESLWTVAEQVNPAVDPRVTIGAVRDLNGLGGTSVVESGTQLMVPVFARGG